MIHTISIATDDDIIQFGDDANIHPVYLSRAIITWGYCLNWLEKTIVSGHIFVSFLLAVLGTHLWPLSVHVPVSPAIYCRKIDVIYEINSIFSLFMAS